MNFINSYGATILYIDDYSNLNVHGLFTNSGGAAFTNGIQVSAGGSISYDANNALQLTALGTQITGPLSVGGLFKATAGLSSNSLTIGGSVSSATVAVSGSGAVSQDLSAKSIKLPGAKYWQGQCLCPDICWQLD